MDCTQFLQSLPANSSPQYQEATADEEEVEEEYYDETQLPEPSEIEPSDAGFEQ